MIMKMSGPAVLLLALLLAVSDVTAFQPVSIPSSASFRSSESSVLSAVKSPQENHAASDRTNPTSAFAAAFASSVAAWTLASQVAFAGMLPVNSVDAAPVYSELSYSSVVVAVETMDFSMPSYSDAVTGTKSIKSSDGVPAFNPFGDFKPDFRDKEATTFPAPAPAPTPAPAATVEMPKMPDLKVPEFKAPDAKVPEFKAPDIVIPEFKMPEFQAPSFSMPKLDMPKMDMPKMDMPKMDMPKMDMPKFDLPKMDMPKFDMPKMDMPKVDMPKMDMPKFDMPSSRSGNGYELDLPKSPKAAMPTIDMPKIDMPKLPAFSNPFAGGSSAGTDSSSSDVMLSPREVRDENARQARQVYLDADNDAKVIEQQARDVRAVANDKKKLAAEAKDLACADRPGGKWICLRNPFTAGF